MALISSENTYVVSGDKQSFVVPLILVTSLFFLWGLAYGLLDVLNKHFQEILGITKQRSTLLQAAYFGAYFLVALPAGLFMEKWGYKKGIISGLLLYALGALLFYPAAIFFNFSFFLAALFILAAGLTFLETAANPYITVLGKPETSTWRLNLSQSFNGVGAFIGPIVGAQIFFSTGSDGNLDSVKLVYIIIGVIVLLLAFIFAKTQLPEISADASSNAQTTAGGLYRTSHFLWAVVAQFFCVAAQVGIAALFINYCTDSGEVSNSQAAYLLSLGLVLFTVGRFTGTALMKIVPAAKLLAIYAFVNIFLCMVVVTRTGQPGIISLVATFFFNSIMFPTIFALGIKDLGANTKKASSFIIMAIVGGAIVPYVMGSFERTATAFTAPLICYVFVFLYGFHFHKIKHNTTHAKE